MKGPLDETHQHNQSKLDSLSTEQQLAEKGKILRQRMAKKRRKTMLVKKMPTVSCIAQAMRAFFVRGFRQQLVSGYVKSKYLSKFEICDLISPKCFVVLPKGNITMSHDGKVNKLCFKILNSEHIQAYCGLAKPSDKQISSIIDDWIYMAPKSKNIISAYEVFKDEAFYMQLTEYCEGYDNIYQHLKMMNLKNLQDGIPQHLLKMVYQYIIQISNAFAIAHQSNLMHGDFNLSQVICDENFSNFKMINFRPWLVKRTYSTSDPVRNRTNKSSQELQDNSIQLSKKECIRIARARDLYQFGQSIFDLMLGKSNVDETIKTVNVDNGKISEASTTSLKRLMKKSTMPHLDSIPLAWVKMVEGACLLEILHLCMVIDVKRDTVDLFQQIHKMVAQQYARFFDSSFKPYQHFNQINNEVRCRDIAVGLNNRAVLARFKIMTHELGKIVSETENQRIFDFQLKLLEKACKIDHECEEAQFNLCLLLWSRGQINDDEFCEQIKQRVADRLTAQWICLVFRKAIALPVDESEEMTLLRTIPRDHLAIQLSEHYRDFETLKIPVHTNMEVHLTHVIPGGAQNEIGIPKLHETPSTQVKKIFFSRNEQFIVLITENQAVVLKLTFTGFDVIGQIDLPTVENSKQRGSALSSRFAQYFQKPKPEQDEPDFAETNPQIQTTPEAKLRQRSNTEAIKAGQDSVEINLNANAVYDAQSKDELKIPETSPTQHGDRPGSAMSKGGDSETDVVSQSAISDNQLDGMQQMVGNQASAGQQSPTKDDKLEKQRKWLENKRKQCYCQGYFNTPWVAAISNDGSHLILHNIDSVTLESRTPQDDELDMHELEHNPNRQGVLYHHDDELEYFYSGMKLDSKVYLYSGEKFAKKRQLQIGRLCPDEVLEICLDQDQDQQSNISEEQMSDRSFQPGFQTENRSHQSLYNIQDQGEELDQDIAAPDFQEQTKQSTFFQKRVESHSALHTNRDQNSPRIEKSHENSSQKNLPSNSGSLVTLGNDKMGRNEGPIAVADSREQEKKKQQQVIVGGENIALENVDKSPNDVHIKSASQFSFASSLKNGSAPNAGQSGSRPLLQKIMQVKCKNLRQYDVVYQMAQDDTNDLFLISPSKPLAGGATFPVSIYRDPYGAYKQAPGQENTPPGSGREEQFVPLKDKHGVEISFKNLHFEHMREFIQKQETVGNMIKFAKFDDQFAIGYQSRFYNGLKPHFFVYEILKRRVVRRSPPINNTFSLEQFQKDQDNPSTLQVYKGENNNSAISSGASNSGETDNSTGDDSQFDQDVSIFEVSPNGNYMISVVENELLCFKMLPRGVNHFFQYNLQPAYLCDEHPLASHATIPSDKDPQPSNRPELQSFDGIKRMAPVHEPGTLVIENQRKGNEIELESKSHRLSPKIDEGLDGIMSHRQRGQSPKNPKKVGFQIDVSPAVQQNSNMDPSVDEMSVVDEKTLADQLVNAYNDYEDYIGSTYQKHVRLVKLHSMLQKALAAPHTLLNPQAAKYIIKGFSAQSEQLSQVSSPLANNTNSPHVDKKIGNLLQAQSLAEATLENVVQKVLNPPKEQHTSRTQAGIVSNRTIKKCLQAIKDYNASYSMLTSQSAALNNSVVNNMFSQKTAIRSLQKLTTFDQIAFRRTSDQIKRLVMCTHPRKWMVAVFYARTLQIYDQINGQQLFEIHVPSAKKISFLDNEQLVVVQEGASTIYLCTIECQRKAFLNKGSAMKKIDAITVQEYEENQKISEYELGLSRQRIRVKRQYSEHSDSNEENEEESGGVKLINWDEEIVEFVTARNTSPYGYMGLIGRTKISIFLGYADEENCVFDHVWTINFIELRKHNIGRSIKLIDFSLNCESFVCYTNTGHIATFDLKRLKLSQKIYLCKQKTETPISHIKSVANNNKVVTYSQAQNKLMIIDAEGIKSNPKDPENARTIDDFIIRITPSAEGFGRVVNFQVDNTDQFLVCAFEKNKLAVYGMKSGSVLMSLEDPLLICEDSFIDENCCYMATLDEHRRQANIYTFEWIFKVETPTAPKKKTQAIDAEEEATRKARQELEESQRQQTLNEQKRNAKSKLCAIF